MNADGSDRALSLDGGGVQPPGPQVDPARDPRALAGPPRDFCEVEKAIPGVARRVLSTRMRELKAGGIVTRTVHTAPRAGDLRADGEGACARAVSASSAAGRAGRPRDTGDQPSRRTEIGRCPYCAA